MASHQHPASWDKAATRQGRRDGALAALAVASLCVAIAGPMFVALGLEFDEFVILVAVPTLATGLLCGWIFARGRSARPTRLGADA